MDYFKLYTSLVDSRRDVVYERFIHHRHHILPRCMGGNDKPDNLVVLTFKEHFIAHRLLCKMYPDNRKLWFALNCMYTRHGFKNTSRSYDNDMVRISPLLGQNMKDKVYAISKTDNIGRFISREQYYSDDNFVHISTNKVHAINVNGNKEVVSKEQYKLRDDLIYHTTDKVYAKTPCQSKEIVSKEEYARRDDLTFHTAGMVACLDDEDNIQWVTSDFYKDNKDSLRHVVVNTLFTFKDTIMNQNVTLTKQRARELNVDYRKYCFDNKLPITKKRYQQTIESVKRITKGHLNRPEYKRKRGEVVVWDINELRYKVVDTSTFSESDFLVGTTKGMATVWDPDTQKFIKRYKHDSEVGTTLRGPNVGKYNVIDRSTGIKYQKTKEQLTENDISVSTPGMSHKLTAKRSIHFLEWKYGLIDRQLWDISTEQQHILQQKIDKMVPIIKSLTTTYCPKPTKTDRITECFQQGMSIKEIVECLPDVSLVMIRRVCSQLRDKD